MYTPDLFQQTSQPLTSLKQKGGGVKNLRRQIQDREVGHYAEHFTVEIDPPFAQELLDLNNKDNRAISQKTVAKYSSLMKSGKWSLSAPLVFSDQEELIDGQHRLHAVIKSEKTVLFHVFLGLPHKTASYLDRGKRRTTADVCVIEGHSWVRNYHVTLARWILFPELDYRIFKLETDDLLPIILECRSAISLACSTIGSNSAGHLGCVRAVIARAFYTQKANVLKDFVYCLAKNQTIRGIEDNVALKLNQRILQTRQENKGLSWSQKEQIDAFWLTQTALRVFISREQRETLVKARKDYFPIPQEILEELLRKTAS